MKEYKLLTNQKYDGLEAELNRLAIDRWRVLQFMVAQPGGVIVLLERDRQSPK